MGIWECCTIGYGTPEKKSTRLFLTGFSNIVPVCQKLVKASLALVASKRDVGHRVRSGFAKSKSVRDGETTLPSGIRSSDQRSFLPNLSQCVLRNGYGSTLDQGTTGLVLGSVHQGTQLSLVVATSVDGRLMELCEGEEDAMKIPRSLSGRLPYCRFC